MPISRRSLLKAAAAVPALSLPGIVRAESQSTLRFIPVIDLAFVDPIYSTAQVSRNHGFMVYDTLYGMSSSLQVSPQMLSGTAISGDGLQWDLSLRDGLFWHDGERVLARDCVASIRRWAARDGFGGELMEATAELSAAGRPHHPLPSQASVPAAAAGARQGRDQCLLHDAGAAGEPGPVQAADRSRSAAARSAISPTSACRARATPTRNSSATSRAPTASRIGPRDRRSCITTAWSGPPRPMPAPASPRCRPASRTGRRPRRTICCRSSRRAGDIETRVLDPTRLRLHAAPQSSAAAVRQSGDPPRAAGCDRSVRLHDRGGGRPIRRFQAADRLLRARHADGERGRARRVPRPAQLRQGARPT